MTVPSAQAFRIVDGDPSVTDRFSHLLQFEDFTASATRGTPRACRGCDTTHPRHRTMSKEQEAMRRGAVTTHG